MADVSAPEKISVSGRWWLCACHSARGSRAKGRRLEGRWALSENAKRRARRTEAETVIEREREREEMDR